MFTKNIGIAALLAASPLLSCAYDYGVDVSFPIHHDFFGPEASISKTMQTFGPQKVDLYQEYISGCKKYYGPGNTCDMNEASRMEHNRDQPKAMTNYTEVGFKKIRLSDVTWRFIREFWEDQIAQGGIEALPDEVWPEANTYKNNWSSPGKKMECHPLYEPIWSETEAAVKEWIPGAEKFSRSSLYGIRVYTSGSILATHVDRDPLITSAIINVGQDLDEEWPLEVYDHDGQAHNITMKPGDMVLYESHSILHGRPFPLKGKYYANIFVHFKPVFEGDEEEKELPALPTNEYGVDVSFPIHYDFFGQDASVTETLKMFGPRKIDMYKEFTTGCENFYGPKGKAQECQTSEMNRLELNRDQPKLMTNYTDVGFKKMRLSDDLWRLIREFWEDQLKVIGGDIEKIEEEYWPEGNTYTNHWVSPTRIQDVGPLKEPIWQEVEEKVKEWIPKAKSFSRSSLYGTRVYTSGSILATHVDRDPLITSAIINVGQDLDEEWPLEVYDHDGRAHNITMRPGDMVLYESHSVLHGRPFPLQGNYYANIFVHFKPSFDEDSVDEDQSRDEL